MLIAKRQRLFLPSFVPLSWVTRETFDFPQSWLTPFSQRELYLFSGIDLWSEVYGREGEQHPKWPIHQNNLSDWQTAVHRRFNRFGLWKEEMEGRESLWGRKRGERGGERRSHHISSSSFKMMSHSMEQPSSDSWTDCISATTSNILSLQSWTSLTFTASLLSIPSLPLCHFVSLSHLTHHHFHFH